MRKTEKGQKPGGTLTTVETGETENGQKPGGTLTTVETGEGCAHTQPCLVDEVKLEYRLITLGYPARHLVEIRR